MSFIVKEHQANGVSLYKAACEKEMITSCFHYLNEKLKIEHLRFKKILENI